MSLYIREFNKYPNEKRLCRASITKKKRGDKPIMSFVFAKKTTVLNNETIKVFCDTKIGLVDGAKGTFSDKQIELIQLYALNTAFRLLETIFFMLVNCFVGYMKRSVFQETRSSIWLMKYIKMQ